MPAWDQLVTEFAGVSDASKGEWFAETMLSQLAAVSERRGGKNVLFYSSAFLQKPQVPPYFTQITHEDLNGFMAAMHGMEWDKGLTLILHTPGGVTNAAETIVEYLHSKFEDIETIVPAYAMSAGTMITLATSRAIMGRQSQLGPVDPQMPLGARFVSARAIVDQFDKAKADIERDQKLAHLWAPIIQSMGPALLTEAKNALDYGERMISVWLQRRMFKSRDDAEHIAKQCASFFNDASEHLTHGRRIARDEARSIGVAVEDLEDDQLLQEAALTAYHVATMVFEATPAVKAIWTSQGKAWIKNINTA